MSKSSHAQPKSDTRREWRGPPWVWAAVFIVLAGPLNPCAWVLGRPMDGNIVIVDMPTFAFAILMPCTVIALVMQDRMWRVDTFTTINLFNWSGVGFVLAVLFGPLGFGMAGVYLGQIEVFDIFGIYIMAVTFGVVFMIVPYFIVMIGLPCAFAAGIAAFVCSRRVDAGT